MVWRIERSEKIKWNGMVRIEGQTWGKNQPNSPNEKKKKCAK